MQNETGDEAGMTQLETKRLLLRPFTEGDTADLYEYAKDPKVGLAAVWCSHYADNPQSQRVIEKSGFSFRMEETVVDGPTGQEKPTKFYVLTREMWESRP